MGRQHNTQLDWIEEDEEVVRPIKVKPAKKSSEWEREEVKQRQRKQKQKNKWEQWE